MPWHWKQLEAKSLPGRSIVPAFRVKASLELLTAPSVWFSFIRSLLQEITDSVKSANALNKINLKDFFFINKSFECCFTQIGHKVSSPFQGSDFIISFVANHARLFKISQDKFPIEKSEELESEKSGEAGYNEIITQYMGLTLVFLKSKGSLMKDHFFGKIVCFERSPSGSINGQSFKLLFIIPNWW